MRREGMGAALEGACVVSLGLRSVAAALVPPPVVTVRELYEYVALHPFSPGCCAGLYCYRVLGPLLVRAIPLP